MRHDEKTGQKEFESIEEAGNYLQEYKDTYREKNRKAVYESDAITTATFEERFKYLNYGIHLLNEELRENGGAMEHGKAKILLRNRLILLLRIRNCSYERMSTAVGVSIETIKKAEEEAVQMVCDLIEKKKKIGLPIFGEN